MTVLRMVVSLSTSHFSWNDKMRVLTYNNNYQSRSKLECGATCSLHPDCWSASYNDGNGTCLLSDVEVFQNNWITDAEWLTLAKTGKHFLFKLNLMDKRLKHKRFALVPCMLIMLRRLTCEEMFTTVLTLCTVAQSLRKHVHAIYRKFLSCKI